MAPGTPSTNPDDYPGEQAANPSGASNYGGAWWARNQQNIRPSIGGSQSAAAIAALGDPNSVAYNYVVPKSNLEGGWFEMTPGEQALFNTIAASLGASNTGPGTLARFISMSAKQYDEGINQTPTALAWDYAVKNGLVKNDGSFVVRDSNAGPKYGGGPSAPPYIDQTAARRAMDTVTTSLIGRTLSDKEFQNYYGAYKGRATANPRIDVQQDMTDATKAEGDYQEYQVANKFATALKSVMRGSW